MTTSTVKTNAVLLAIGADFARADLAAHMIGERLAAALPEGRSMPEHDAAVAILRAGYKTERGCSDEAAAKAILRLMTSAGISRPKSTGSAAVAKDASRKEAAKKGADVIAAEHKAKADALVADAEKAQSEGKAASAKVMLAKAAEAQAKAELVLETAAIKSVAEKERAAKVEFKSAATRVADAMKADASVAGVLAWACDNLPAIVAMMQAAQSAELSKGLATAGKRPIMAAPKAKPVKVSKVS